MYYLVGTCFIRQVHQGIAVNNSSQKLMHHGCIQVEAGLLLQTVDVEADDRDVRKAGFFQSLAQQIDIVGGTAAATGLGDNQRSVLQVIFATFQSVYQLADNKQCRIADIIIDVFQTGFDYLAAGVVQNLGFVAAAYECCLQQ